MPGTARSDVKSRFLREISGFLKKALGKKNLNSREPNHTSAGYIQRERLCLFYFVLVSRVVILAECSYVSVAVGHETQVQDRTHQLFIPLICPQLFSFILYLIEWDGPILS